MQSIFLALGANLGDRAATLSKARAALQRAAGINLLAHSPLYETEPVGGPEGQGPYLNAVVAATTELDPQEVLALCQELEREFGRERGEAWGPRTLDLDILCYGDQVLETPALVLPHPRLHERRFVLAPLCDLAPELVHPVLKKSVRRLLAELDSPARVRRLDQPW